MTSSGKGAAQLWHRRWGTLGPRSGAILVAGAAVATYLPALANGFVWDDPLILTYQLPAFHGLRDVLLPPRDLPHAGSFYYRPLVFLSYLADLWLGDGSAVPFHVTPILFHALASVLLLLLIWELLGRREWLAPMLGALAFAVHPAHVEVVAWMAGRADSMATAAALAALLAWGRWLESRRWDWLLAGALAQFAGLMAKESAIVAAILGATLAWVWPARGKRAGSTVVLLWMTIAATLLAYGLLRGVALSVTPGATLGLDAAALAPRLLGALGFYTAALIWPMRPGVVLTAVPGGWDMIGVGLAGAVLAVVGLGVALRRRAALPAWALAWILAALVPALLLAVRYISETPVAERYLYLPSAGAALLVACGCVALPRSAGRAATIAVLVVLVTIAVVTARRSMLWRDEITFWRNAIALAPEEGPPHLKLAGALLERNDLAAAEAAYRQAFDARLTAEQQAIAKLNLARLLLMRGEAGEAEPLARTAMEVDKPNLVASAAYLLGHVSLARGDRDAAIRWFTHATRVAPQSKNAADASAALAALQGG